MMMWYQKMPKTLKCHFCLFFLCVQNSFGVAKDPQSPVLIDRSDCEMVLEPVLELRERARHGERQRGHVLPPDPLPHLRLGRLARLLVGKDLVGLHRRVALQIERHIPRKNDAWKRREKIFKNSSIFSAERWERTRRNWGNCMASLKKITFSLSTHAVKKPFCRI